MWWAFPFWTNTGEFQYKPGAIMTNILLADEINRTSSKTQSALLEAMEEGRVTVDGVTHPLPDPFFVLATQNPVGSAGTQMLPNSQLDRFMIRLSMVIPTPTARLLSADRRNVNPLDQISLPCPMRNYSQRSLRRRGTYGRQDLRLRHALTEATRGHPLVSLGVSPRGALALCRMTKARAYLAGRDFAVRRTWKKSCWTYTHTG